MTLSQQCRKSQKQRQFGLIYHHIVTLTQLVIQQYLKTITTASLCLLIHATHNRNFKHQATHLHADKVRLTLLLIPLIYQEKILSSASSHTRAVIK